MLCFFAVGVQEKHKKKSEDQWEVVEMFTCIACTKQTAEEGEEGCESGTSSTKEVVKSLSAQVLSPISLFTPTNFSFAA